MTTFVRMQVLSRTQALALLHVKPELARTWTNKAASEELVKLGQFNDANGFMIVKDGEYGAYQALAKSQETVTA